MYILTQMPSEGESVRAMAGLLLKNNIRLPGQLPPPVLQYIKDTAVRGLGDASALVRGTLGIIVTTLVTKQGLGNWPELLPRLMELMDSAVPAAIEARTFDCWRVLSNAIGRAECFAKDFRRFDA
jgi:transportin-1